jgi:hypothetical protein
MNFLITFLITIVSGTALSNNQGEYTCSFLPHDVDFRGDSISVKCSLNDKWLQGTPKIKIPKKYYEAVEAYVDEGGNSPMRFHAEVIVHSSRRGTLVKLLKVDTSYAGAVYVKGDPWKHF